MTDSSWDKFWENWQPTERATLLFIIHDQKILLILKKRGLGAGKINGPGGRIEPGESALQAAIRETQEELHVTALNPQQRGELHFQFADGYALYCAVFVAFEFSGTATETDEAVPLWTPLDAIPYEKMWADDQHWLPGVIEGKSFRGFFNFDSDTMTKYKIDWMDEKKFKF